MAECKAVACWLSIQDCISIDWINSVCDAFAESWSPRARSQGAIPLLGDSCLYRTEALA